MGKIVLAETAQHKLTLTCAVKKRKLTNTQIFEAPIDDGQILDMAGISSIIGEYVQKNKLQGANVIIIIRSSQLVLRIHKLPSLHKKDLQKYVNVQLPDILPVELEKYVVDYRILRKSKTAVEILFAAIPIDISESYVKVFKQAGLMPIRIDAYKNTILSYAEKYLGSNLLIVIEDVTRLVLILITDNYEVIETNSVKFPDGSRELSRLISLLGGSFEKVFLLTSLDWVKECFSGLTVENIPEDLAFLGLLCTI